MGVTILHTILSNFPYPFIIVVLHMADFNCNAALATICLLLWSLLLLYYGFYWFFDGIFLDEQLIYSNGITESVYNFHFNNIKFYITKLILTGFTSPL